MIKLKLEDKFSFKFKLISLAVLFFFIFLKDFSSFFSFSEGLPINGINALWPDISGIERMVDPRAKHMNVLNVALHYYTTTTFHGIHPWIVAVITSFFELYLDYLSIETLNWLNNPVLAVDVEFFRNNFYIYHNAYIESGYTFNENNIQGILDKIDELEMLVSMHPIPTEEVYEIVKELITLVKLLFGWF